MATNQNTQTSTTNQKSSNRTVIIILILLVIALLFGRSWFSWGQANITTETISQELGTAKQAEIFLATGINVLNVSASPNTMLVTGTVEVSSREKLEQSFEMNGDTAVYKLETKETTGFRWFSRNTRRDWNLQLNPDIPLALTLKTGVGEVHLDLSLLNVTDLELHTGVGATTVEFPEVGQIKADIEAGVGEITIRIPEGMAARIEAKAGIGNIKVSENFGRNGDAYVSSNYDSATNHVDLEVSGGIGQVNIETSL
jgi:hypothetical protein